MNHRRLRNESVSENSALRALLGILTCLCGGTIAQADVRLPAIISDHMVVQAETAVPIWGWAEPAEEVKVSLAGEAKTTTAGADGKWLVRLGPLRASAEAKTLAVAGKNKLTVSDVLVGEVWLCSGQSNMEMQLRGLHGEVDRADEEIAAANYPQIRMFVHRQIYDIYKLPAPPAEPLTDRAGAWLVCSPDTAASFTAIGYFFARELHRQLDLPIGIINAAVGGTPIEAWTSLPAQQAEPALEPVLADWQQRLSQFDPDRAQHDFELAKQQWLKQRALLRTKGEEPPKAPARFKNLRVMAPGALFNGVIAPLVPYSVRGVLWYQGERNAAGPLTHFYGVQLRTLVEEWRARWGQQLYFAWVQLPRIQKEQRAPSEPNGWGVAVREAMRKSLSLPRTGMAITIDYGGVTDGHPTNKADFAARLTLLALHDVYGKPIPLWSGPLFREAKRDGDKMVLTFDHATGLKSSAGELRAFAIAGADRRFVWANAKIVVDKVVVWSDDVSEPHAVRYGWAANPACNLVNAAGLPASPFRTDDWE
jgi:sialate O-acetylesterase